MFDKNLRPGNHRIIKTKSPLLIRHGSKKDNDSIPLPFLVEAL